MGDTRIYDYKVILLDGIFFVLRQKASGAVFHIK